MISYCVECALCAIALPLRLLEDDRIITGYNGVEYVVGNIQLLCGYCNRVKQKRTDAEAMQSLLDSGVIDAARLAQWQAER